MPSQHIITYKLPQEVNDYINKLSADIERYKKISNNVKAFMIDRGLIPFDMSTDNSYGTKFLIKGKTIFEFSTYPKISDRLSLFSGIDEVPTIETTTYTHNIFVGDINEFRNTDVFMSKEDMVSRNLDTIEQFQSALLRNGFKAFIKKVDVGDFSDVEYLLA